MKWWLNKPPMTVQLEALRRSEGRIGYNYWLEVGLGKTIIELNEWADDYNAGRADFHVVICLNSFKQTWLDEIDNFGAPGGSKAYTLWSKPVSVDYILAPGKLGIVMNWEALIGSGGDALMRIATRRKVRVCFDEGHRIKTPTAQVSKFAVKFWKDTVDRRSLTGTPITNSVLDMFVPLKLGEQLDGMNPFVFRNRFALMGGFKGRQLVGINPERLPELHALRDRAGWVATKKEWMPDLPPQRWVTPIRVELHDRLKSHYTDMARDFYTMLDTGDEVSANMIITQLLRLQQISSGFATTSTGEEVTLLPIEQSLKFKALLDLTEQREGSKLLVFTHYVWTTRHLLGALQRELGPEAVAVMRGQTHTTHVSETEEEKKRFNSDDACRVMVAQSTVASESHTLLGTSSCPCHGSLFYENTYNLRTRIQAEGRNHRKGQSLPVDYYDIVSSEIEAIVIRALQNKFNLVEAVMSRLKEMT